MLKTEKIQNLVFDFGGVIYQIDFDRQKRAFLDLGIGSFEKLYSQDEQNLLFCDLETGKITNDIFRERLVGLTMKKISYAMVDRVWNSILIGYYDNRVHLLQKLKTKYHLYLLSNTNAIHYKFYTDQFLKHFGYNLNSLFHRTYWSFEIGMRKPEPEIFEKIITENELTHENALFIDDSIQNVESAENAGLPSYWLQSETDLLDVFDANLNVKLE
jgi:putative hydrolase of the HAD superfamily